MVEEVKEIDNVVVVKDVAVHIFQIEPVNTAISGPTEHLTFRSQSLINYMLIDRWMWPPINLLRSIHALRI